MTKAGYWHAIYNVLNNSVIGQSENDFANGIKERC